MSLDPVQLAVIANRLDTIVREMENTLLRTGRSAVLNMARDLLQTTDANVDDIAHRVGYRSLPAFIRVFKHYLGVSPASWRKAL